MRDHDKPREALIQELTELRQRVADIGVSDSETAKLYCDLASVLIVALDRQGNITFVNQRAVTVLGLSHDTLIGANWFSTCVPEDIREKVRRIFEQVMLGNIEGSEHFRNEIVTSSGQRRAISWHNTFLRDETGIIGTVSSGDDITERLETEENLRLLVLAIDQSSEGVALVGLEGTILRSNTAFAAMHGYASKELIGKNLSIFHTEEQMPSVIEANRETEETGSFSGEIWHVRKDGAVFPSMMLNNLIRDGNGAPVGIIGTMRDISEAKAAEERRRDLERQVLHSQKLESLGVLAGGIAHDFNNLLMAILGNADVALLEMPERSVASDCIREIETAAVRAGELCRQMLAYSGKGNLTAVPVDLAALVLEMAHLLQISIPKKVRIVYELNPDTPIIMADPSQLRQVVMNLITNAAEAIGDAEGTVTLNLCVATEYNCLFGSANEIEGPCLLLKVIDTGCGMDEATRMRVFDPFFSTKFKGRGLGLAAVQGIVRAHGGVIDITSEPGRGTTMAVFIPSQSEPTPAPEPIVTLLDEWQGAGIVLLVDDEESVQASVTKMLDRLGFTVVNATDGFEAIEIIKFHGDEIRALILDVTMPSFDGRETLREIRHLGYEMPVVLSSGHQEEWALEGIESLANGFLQKPYQLTELRSTLKSILEAPEI